MDDDSDGYRHESVPNNLHTWRLTGYDALQFIRTSNPWIAEEGAPDETCFYCGRLNPEHDKTCEWKRAQDDT